MYRFVTLLFAAAFLTAAVADDSYVIDALEFPKDMPPEIGALDFDSEGLLYVSLRRGDIMVAQPTDDPSGFKWKRFATGFHNGCGMHIVKPGHIIVSQMAELTEVIDTDGDGVADVYNHLKTGIGLSGNYHETNAICPDGKGGLYIAAGTASHNGPTSSTPLGRYSKIGRYGRNYSAVQFRGWIIHRAADGTLTPFSSGYRMHNGIEFDPKTGVWCGDNQGDWRAGSPVYHVAPDSFAGHPSSLVWDPRMASFGNVLYLPRILLDDLWHKPAFHLSHGMIKSCAEPIFDTTGGAFGPFTGQMLVPDQSGSQIIRCMPEWVDGAYQGGAVPFFKGNGLRRGNNRLAFSPQGDTLYIGQTGRGWGALSEGMQRIRFTGVMPFDLLHCSLTHDGFDLTFTQPVDAESATGLSAERYRYAYGYRYGGGAPDKSSVALRDVQVDPADPRTVRVRLSKLVPNFIYDLRFSGVKSAKGETVRNGSVVYTLNRLRRPEAKQPVTVTASNDRLRVEMGGKLFTEIRSQGFSNPILYPINNPDGQSLVRDWPVVENGRKGEQEDHPHHKSLFIGHQRINDIDFWHEKEGCGTTEQVKVIETRSGEDRALVRTLNLWKDPAGKVICSDTREWQFGRVNGARYIDLELNMHASHGDLKFHEFKDGFVGMRTHPHLRLNAHPDRGVKEVFGKAVNSAGVRGEGIWGKRADWVHYWGKVEGRDAGVAILAHPANPRMPAWWHARDYGLIAANPFGPKGNGADGEMIVPSGESFTLRYRFVFHNQTGEAADIARQYASYAEQELVPRTEVLPIPDGALASTAQAPRKPVVKRGGTVQSITRYVDGEKAKPATLIPHGLVEGQAVYVDREFQFARVPEALRGADLIMTYNNDKKLARSNVRYEVKVDQPSSLLVLMDTRVENTVGWLQTGPLEFNRTEEKVQTDFEFEFRVYKGNMMPGTYSLGSQTGGSFYAIAVLKN